MSTDLKKRAFYLMMSVGEGQDLTELAGMIPASDDVAAAEQESLSQQWALFHQLGLLEGVFEGAEWFADLSMIHHEIHDLVAPDQLEAAWDHGLSDEEIIAQCHQQVHRTIGAFGVALIHKLLSEGRISVPAPKRRFLS